MRIFQSPHMVRKVLRFPDKPRTKRRMRRLRGKYGSAFYFEPYALETPQGIIMHPALFKALSERFTKPTNDGVKWLIEPKGVAIRRAEGLLNPGGLT